MADEAQELTRGANYIITPEDEAFIGTGSPRERVRNNIAALRLARELTDAGRAATLDEKRVLARFVGWGGLPQVFVPEYERLYDYETDKDGYWSDLWGQIFREKAEKATLGMEGYELHKQIREALGQEAYEAARGSTLNAHYTAVPVIRAMHRALNRLGVKGGRFLEPSAGIGHFLGTGEYQAGVEWVAVELDKGTGEILKLLYPDAHTVIGGYETLNVPDNFFDAAVSNVPFGDYKLHDPRYNKRNFFIHDYFFAKSLDKVRPGGVVAFITSSGTMDKQSDRLRRYVAEAGGQFLGAVRLPESAFDKNANTKVVTDIIFLRRVAEGETVDNSAWDGLEEIKVGGKRVSVNRYFAQNPGQVLGTFSLEHGQYGADSLTVKPKPGDLAEQIDAALARVLPENVVSYVADPRKETAEQRRQIYDAKGLKEGNIDLVDGKLVRKSGELMEPLKLPRGVKKSSAVKVVRSLLPVREALRELVSGQIEGCDEGTLTRLQGALNRAYNAFVKAHGALNLPANKAVVGADLGDGLRLLALEKWDAKKKKAEKADIFSRRVIAARGARAASADSAADALTISLHESGTIDAARMAELTGRTADDVLGELERSGAVFHNPETSGYETADEYLSGRVRRKLLAAEGAAALDDRYMRNVAALREVQPDDIPVDQISFSLGQAWIPVDVYERFAEHVAQPCTVIHNAMTNAWQLKRKNDRSDGSVKFGTGRKPAYQIMQALMNGSAIRVMDSFAKRVDQEATAQALEKADLMTREFDTWIRGQEDLARDLARLYNDTMNDEVPRNWDSAAALEVPGMSAKWRGLMSVAGREYQKRAVVRALHGGNILLAHAVGAGKTLEMATVAMELRRMGLARKPLFVVPNHMLEQWGREFTDIFPAANVLVAEKNELSGKKRGQFVARVANGDWDAVIMAHSTFSRIGMSNKAEAAYIEEELKEMRDALEAARDDADAEGGRRSKSGTRVVKQLEKQIAKAKARLEKLMASETKDKAVTFEELGVDYLFVDEAHNFKGIAILTKNGRVPGMGQQTSQRAQDMEMKTRYISGLHGGRRGVVFATGTPVSNSMCEMYVMMRYLAAPRLRAMGLFSFDAWAKQFGQVVKAIEASPTGKGFRIKERFAKFQNVPEMKGFFRSFTDVVQSGDLDVERPEVKGGKPVVHEIQPSKAQLRYVDTLVERAEAVAAGDVSPEDDNMLKITNDGRMVAMDARLVGLPDDGGARLAACAGQVAEIYRRTAEDRAAQLVFCDIGIPSQAALRAAVEADADAEGGAAVESGDVSGAEVAAGPFNVYDELAKMLVARGVKRSEIAYIHEARNDQEKAEIFAKVRSGEIRVLIGNTPRMGEGTNVQDRLIALHHLDAPWKPAWVEQRNGRIVRPGNRHAEIELHHYVTQKTFDVYMWQTIERKSQFIAQALSADTGARTLEDCDSSPLTYAEIKACATGDPRIVEKFKLERDVEALQRRIQAVRDNEGDDRWRLRTAEAMAKEAAEKAARVREMVERARKVQPKEWEFVDRRGNVIKDNEALAKYFADVLTTAKRAGANVPTGTYAGMTIFADGMSGDGVFIPVINARAGATQKSAAGGVTFTPSDVVTLKSSITRQMSDDRLAELDKDAKDRAAKAEKIRAEFGESDTVALGAELAQVEARLEELNKELGIGKDDGQAAASDDAPEFSVSREDGAEASEAEGGAARGDVEAAARAMGVEVSWGDAVEMQGIDGMVRDGKIVLNPDADRGALLRFTFGHEVGHIMQGEKGWADFLLRLERLVGRGAVDKYLEDLNARRKRIGLTPLTKKEALREIAADLVGAKMADARFWNRVKNLDAPLWRRVVNWVKGWFSKVAPDVVPFNARELFDDPDKFAEAMGEVEAFIMRRREAQGGVDADAVMRAYDFVMNGGPVAELSGGEFPPGGARLTEAVPEFYEREYGGAVENPELGRVSLDRESVRDSIGHGVGRLKAAAFAAVPDVLRKGMVFDWRENWKGRGYDTAVVAAPIKIGGEDCICEVVVKRSPKRQGFYVHEVEVKKKPEGAFKTAGGSAPPASRLIISRLVAEVKAGDEEFSVSRDEAPSASLGRIFKGAKDAWKSEPKSRDLSRLAVLIGQMAWYSEKVPTIRRLFERGQRALDDRHEIAAKYFGVRGRNESDLNTFLTFMRGGHGPFARKLCEEGRRLNEYLVRVDRDRDGATITEEDGVWIVTAPDGKGRVEVVHKGESEQAALDAMHDWECERLIAWGFSVQAAEALRAFRDIHDREYADLVKSYRDHQAEMEELGVKPDKEWRDLFAELRKIGNLRGTYYPRLRKGGRYVLTYEQDGLRYLERFDTAMQRMTREARLRADGAEITGKSTTDTPSEEAFDSVQMVAMNDFLRNALGAVERMETRMDWGAIGLSGRCGKRGVRFRA